MISSASVCCLMKLISKKLQHYLSSEENIHHGIQFSTRQSFPLLPMNTTATQVQIVAEASTSRSMEQWKRGYDPKTHERIVAHPKPSPVQTLIENYSSAANKRDHNFCFMYEYIPRVETPVPEFRRPLPPICSVNLSTAVMSTPTTTLVTTSRTEYRKLAIERWKRKRERRPFVDTNRSIMECRSTIAKRRPRVGGKFIKHPTQWISITDTDHGLEK